MLLRNSSRLTMQRTIYTFFPGGFSPVNLDVLTGDLQYGYEGFRPAATTPSLLAILVLGIHEEPKQKIELLLLCSTEYTKFMLR